MRLEKTDFDSFIWTEFVKFLKKEGNHIIYNGGMILRDGVEFHALNVPSRNPIVDDKIWKEILLNHLKNRYN